ncbi:MAG: hypothetical protein LBM19_04555 [Holosporales bacterium]|jgi:hypothetical protein|nr:hypothetical protein [Holosporales bacterium]
MRIIDIKVKECNVKILTYLLERRTQMNKKLKKILLIGSWLLAPALGIVWNNTVLGAEEAIGMREAVRRAERLVKITEEMEERTRAICGRFGIEPAVVPTVRNDGRSCDELLDSLMNCFKSINETVEAISFSLLPKASITGLRSVINPPISDYYSDDEMPSPPCARPKYIDPETAYKIKYREKMLKARIPAHLLAEAMLHWDSREHLPTAEARRKLAQAVTEYDRHSAFGAIADRISSRADSDEIADLWADRYRPTYRSTGG